MADHYLTLCNDFDGWDYAECACGWVGPPCPDVETAAEFYSQHVVIAVTGGDAGASDDTRKQVGQ